MVPKERGGIGAHRRMVLSYFFYHVRIIDRLFYKRDRSYLKMLLHYNIIYRMYNTSVCLYNRLNCDHLTNN